MSRIGRKAVAVPSGVEIKQGEGTITVKGPKGELSAPIPAAIGCEVADGEIKFTRGADDTKTRALHGLARALTANLVTGVTDGFSKELEIQGVGYRAEMKGKSLNLLLGFSHPVEMPVPEGLKRLGRPEHAHQDRGHRQAAGRPVRGRHPLAAAAGALQGQGHPLQRRVRATQGRQGGGQRR